MSVSPTLDKLYCYIAGIFPLIACALIGEFGITWHLTMKLFPTKSLWTGERVTMQCYPWMLTEDRRCTWTERDWRWCDHGVWLARFSKFCFHITSCNLFVVLYNKSLNDWSLGKPVNFVSLESQCFPLLRLRKHWDSRETELTVSLGTSH